MIPILRTFPTAPEKENTRDDGPRLSIRKALRDSAWHCHKGLYKVPSRHGKIALRSAQNKPPMKAHPSLNKLIALTGAFVLSRQTGQGRAHLSEDSTLTRKGVINEGN